MVPVAKQSPIVFLLDRKKNVSLQTQLSLNLKRLVHSGILRPGKAVPSSRELAHDLKISRNTVIQAYDRLIGEGYLEASARCGLYVSELLEVENLRRAGLAGVSGPTARSIHEDMSQRLKPPVPFQPCQTRRWLVSAPSVESGAHASPPQAWQKPFALSFASAAGIASVATQLGQLSSGKPRCPL